MHGWDNRRVGLLTEFCGIVVCDLFLIFFCTDPPSLSIKASNFSLSKNLFSKQADTSADMSAEYGLLPGTAAIFDCMTVEDQPYTLFLEWKTYTDSSESITVLLEKGVSNQSRLSLNVTREGIYLCVATIQFSKCRTATRTTTVQIKVNELSFRK